MVQISEISQKASDQFLQIASLKDRPVNPCIQELAKKIKNLSWPHVDTEIVYRRGSEGFALQFSKEGDLLRCKKEGREGFLHGSPLPAPCLNHIEWSEPNPSPANSSIAQEEKDALRLAAVKEFGSTALKLAGTYLIGKAAWGILKTAGTATGRVLASAASVGIAAGAALLGTPVMLARGAAMVAGVAADLALETAPLILLGAGVAAIALMTSQNHPRRVVRQIRFSAPPAPRVVYPRMTYRPYQMGMSFAPRHFYRIY